MVPMGEHSYGGEVQTRGSLHHYEVALMCKLELM